jgi:hypothetical protein
MKWDLIYLDKHGDDDHYPRGWTYYRMRSTTALGSLPETWEAVCRSAE